MNDKSEDRRKYCNLCGRNIGIRSRGGICDVCKTAYKKGAEDEREKLDNNLKEIEGKLIFTAECLEGHAKKEGCKGVFHWINNSASMIRGYVKEMQELSNCGEVHTMHPNEVCPYESECKYFKNDCKVPYPSACKLHSTPKPFFSVKISADDFPDKCESCGRPYSKPSKGGKG
jgi:hypothetical protein